MQLHLTTVMLALAATALPTFAKTITVTPALGNCILVGGTCYGETVRFGMTEDGRPYSDSMDKAYEMQVPNIDPLSGIVSGIFVKCYWVGQANDDVEEIDFYLENSASYIRPCGPHHGITMICSEPYPTCQ